MLKNGRAEGQIGDTVQVDTAEDIGFTEFDPLISKPSAKVSDPRRRNLQTNVSPKRNVLFQQRL